MKTSRGARIDQLADSNKPAITLLKQTSVEHKKLLQVILLIAARKRSLRRLCFHRCLSGGGGGVCLWSRWGVSATPLQADTPLGRHPTPGQTPPAQCLLGYTHPLPSACWDTHPPAQCMLGYTPPPAQCMLGYSQQARGTHPTGMHSCYLIVCDTKSYLGCFYWIKVFSRTRHFYIVIVPFVLVL